jgi:hypothetical protein
VLRTAWIDENRFAMSWPRFPNCRRAIGKLGWLGVKLPEKAHTADLVRKATPEVWFPEIGPVKRAPRQKQPSEPSGMDADIRGLVSAIGTTRCPSVVYIGGRTSQYKGFTTVISNPFISCPLAEKTARSIACRIAYCSILLVGRSWSGAIVLAMPIGLQLPR